MKFTTVGLLSILIASTTFAAPVSQADATADAVADTEAWRWHKWFRNQAIYKREADASAVAEAEADANAEAWRWHKWFRNQAIYRREDEPEQAEGDLEEEEYDGKEPIGFAYAFADDDKNSEPVAFFPMFASDFEEQPTNGTNVAKRDADADAEAWRWHKWFRNQAIYKRDAEADANPDAWRWHKWFRNQAIY
ncbi:unnamed protein product [Pichia kudriavzevii]